ncbi:MAG: TRAP transporter large permease [Clostridiales bacterium]|nr:TRAP transporter large permease [Clostridiales bacterium]
MEPITIGFIGLAVMVLLIVLKVQIGVAMGVVGVVGFGIIVGWPAAFGLLQNVPYSTVASYSLSVIILFVLMGQFLSVSKMSDDLFDCAQKWIGKVPGGLAMATVVACFCVGALCGSTTATTATMGIVSLPAMKERKYNDGFAAATVACASTLSTMVPPSVLLILYGVTTTQSIGKLFKAVLIPGIMLAVLYMISIYLRIKIDPKMGPAGISYPWKERLAALWKIKDVIIVIILVIGGIISGIFTVNEAGAVGVAGVVVATAIRKKLTYATVKKALLDTGKTVAMIFMIITNAMILGYFFAITQLPANIATALNGLNVSKYIILACIVVLFIFLGAIMDELAMLLVTIPIFYPVVTGLGFDPIWFGVMTVLIMASGMICPPVGMNCFIIAGIDKTISLPRIYKGIMPYWAAIIIMMVLITAFPQICLFLPSVLS